MRSDNIRRVIPEVNGRYGAPMGRSNVIPQDCDLIYLPSNFITIGNGLPQKLYDKRVPMSRCGAYDIGGAYWGIGSELRVRFNKDLTFIEFYRR